MTSKLIKYFKLGIIGIVGIGGVIFGKYIYDKQNEEKIREKADDIIDKNIKTDETILPTYNSREYDEEGFSIETKQDKNGYYKNGYNDLGLDRSGNDKSYYINIFKRIDEVHKKAKKLIKNGDIESGIFQYGKMFENLLKLIIAHKFGEYNDETTTYLYLRKISEKKIIEPTLIENLHEVRKYYNKNKHGLSENSFENVKDFIIKTTDKLYYVTKEILDIA